MRERLHSRPPASGGLENIRIDSLPSFAVIITVTIPAWMPMYPERDFIYKGMLQMSVLISYHEAVWFIPTPQILSSMSSAVCQSKTSPAGSGGMAGRGLVSV